MLGDSLYYPYPSRRQVIHGSRGMVATSQPLAAQVGLHILRSGGNAVDAAVATAACLTVVEPTCNGLGGDAFAQVWSHNKLYGLNASGPAPARLTLEAVRGAGHERVPHDGLLPITVPGVPAAWAALNKRFGRLTLRQCLEPAMDYALKGFPVAATTADLWQAAHINYVRKRHPEQRHWFPAFAPKGRAPEAGEIWSFPEQAATLAAIGDSDARAFYEGELAVRMDAFMHEEGGFLRGEDLQAFQPQWVEPICVNYRGYDVWEIPPNGQGLVCLIALNILKNFDLSDTDSPHSMHCLMEALKLAFADGLAHIAEPDAMQMRIEDVLHHEYGQQRATLIGSEALDPAPHDVLKGGTVYLAASDDEGMMVSYIQSNYTNFGSGVVVPGTGIALQNRGACFSTNPSHPNVLAPGKRSYHTIIPGFLTKDDCPVGPFGMMGAFIQPQGHVMLMHRILDQGLNPQAALDAPRFRWSHGRRVDVESVFPTALAEALRRKGHDIHYGQVGDRDFGRGQIIWRTEQDGQQVLVGGTEPRTDGQVAAY